MNLHSMMGIPLGTVSGTTVPLVPAGDYVKISTAAPTLSAPTDPSWNTLTTLVSDNPPTDPDGRTTYLSRLIGGIGTTGTIEVMRAFSASRTITTFTDEAYYGPGALRTIYYWDGAAWQSWATTLAVHFSDSWSTGNVNPADQNNVLYCLYVLTEGGDGISNAEIRVGDWRLP